MAHGDESGLRLPPRVAPTQVVIVPIFRKENEREAVAAAVEEVERALRAAGVRVKSDWREERPGFKYNDHELRGVPVRLEIGPRDAAAGQVVAVPRTNRGAKETIAKDSVAQRIPQLLDEVQQALYDQALAFQRSRTYRVSDYEEFKAILADKARMGFIEGWWCGDAECEAQIKAETQATIRCLPLEQPDGSGVCIHCGRPRRRGPSTPRRIDRSQLHGYGMQAGGMTQCYTLLRRRARWLRTGRQRLRANVRIPRWIPGEDTTNAHIDYGVWQGRRDAGEHDGERGT